MPRDYSLEGENFLDDFEDEIKDSVLIQNFVRNDGYKDIYSEGIIYPCAVQYEIYNVTMSDGTLTSTTMQIFLGPNAVVTARDKITINGVAPQILRISPDPDNYGLVILT
jgi:hypothetical protein